jgi:hypothetical protein
MSKLSHVEHPGAWTGREMPDKNAITFTLGADAVSELTASATQIRATGRTLQHTGVEDFSTPALTRDATPVRNEIMHGRGLAIVGGLPTEGRELSMLEMIYWGLGLQLGTPVSQSVMGDVLGYVADVTEQEQNVRPYRARKALRLHTDFADVSGLFCIRTAKTGGENRVVSTLSIHDEIASRRPDLLEFLYHGYHFHRLGEQADNESAITTHRVPIFSEMNGQVSCRYSRAYIMEAEAASENVLTGGPKEALDLFDEIANREDMRTSFRLEPGEVLFMNSYTTLHTRTAFEDWQDPAKKRLLLRLWLAAHEPRPVVADVAIYSGNPNGIPVRGSGAPAGFERVATSGYVG